MTPEEAFEEAFKEVILLEGGYSDHPNDSGGETRWGITKAVARANNYAGDMKDLPLHTAKAIYKRQYWIPLSLDTLSSYDSFTAKRMFDIGVNMGIGTAAKFLQRLLNALNRQGSDYPDLTIDGGVGPVTLYAVKRYWEKRGQNGFKVLRESLRALQAVRYVEIAERDPSQEVFVYGWFQRTSKGDKA